MPMAVGMVEVLGWPPALSVADVMVKAARVTLVGYELLSGAFVTIIVRGDVAEVNLSVQSGIRAAEKIEPFFPGDKLKNGKLLLSSHVIPRPHANIETVMPIHFRESVEQFRDRPNSRY
ncbi:MAG: carbon dioxide-concentrating mechanism protein CcmK [Synechococcales bacterium]|nr:carbon dioxide-concentrating mechanism protein CcmK [Cyanobacteria bacterium REEB444]MEB3126070.1 carbon dioxide-concentrating mechanism protein CcmK [Synechococcales bacterium]